MMWGGGRKCPAVIKRIILCVIRMKPLNLLHNFVFKAFSQNHISIFNVRLTVNVDHRCLVAYTQF